MRKNKLALLILIFIILAVCGLGFFWSAGQVLAGDVEIPGLIGHWTMDNADISDNMGHKNMRNRAGTDYAGKILHWGASTQGSTVPGKIKEAYKFNTALTEGWYIGGSGDYIEINNSENLNPDKFSLSVWFKVNKIETPLRTLVGKSSKGEWEDGLGVHFRKMAADRENWLFFFITDDTNDNAYKIFAVGDEDGVGADKNWHHVVTTFDGTKLRIFLDGVEGTSANLEGTYVKSNNVMRIGASTYGSNKEAGFHFNGLIDDVRLYNRALTTDEINALKNFQQKDCIDGDNDGYYVGGGACGAVDCNDSNANINPGELDICGNGIDENCYGGDLACQSGNGPLRVHPTNPRYFTDNSGKPIYLAGWNTWGNVQDGHIEAWDYDWGNPTFSDIGGYSGYLDQLKANNLNYIRLWTWDTAQVRYVNPLNKAVEIYETEVIEPIPWERTGPGNAADDKLKFDVSQFNQAYFDRLHDRVRAAQEQGIYVSVMFFERFSAVNHTMPHKVNGADVSTDINYEAWPYHPFKTTNNINALPDVTKSYEEFKDSAGEGFAIYTLDYPQITELQESYIKKVIDTVNEFDNVIYEIANEVNRGAEYREWELHMINMVKEYEKTKPKQHPIGMTSNTHWLEGDSDVANLPGFEYVTPMGVGDWFKVIEDVSFSYPPATDEKKAFILDTDHMGSRKIWEDKNKARKWVWRSFVRGYNPSLLRYDPAKSGHTEAVRALGDTRAYAEKIDLASMFPVESNDCSSTKYCLASPGKEYLVYQRDLRSQFTVNLSAGKYNYEWFDTISGTVKEPGIREVSDDDAASKNFTPPDSIAEQAVLYVKASNPADVNNDTHVNIKDIQACIKVITGSDLTYEEQCSVLAPPTDRTNIKDIQVIIREIINPS